MKKLLLALALTVSLVFGAGLPIAAPEQSGFSEERLNRIHVVMEDHIQSGRLNGASALLARNGKIVF